MNNSLLHKIKVIDSNLCQHCKVKDNNNHYFFECIQVRHVWNILTEILNLSGNLVYIDLKTAIEGFPDLPTNDYRNLLVDFTRYEVKVANKILTKKRLISRLRDLTIAMKTCGYQKKAWENLFYLLTFEKIEDNYAPNKSGTIPLKQNQQLNKQPSSSPINENENILALPETLFNKNLLFNKSNDSWNSRSNGTPNPMIHGTPKNIFISKKGI